MKLKRIDRNATLAWSQGNHDVLLALGNVAGALDASFSSKTELELFDINKASSDSQTLVRVGGVSVNAR